MDRIERDHRIGRREKWPKQSWEEGEIGEKSREEGEKEKLTFREEGEKGDLTPSSTPLFLSSSFTTFKGNLHS